MMHGYLPEIHNPNVTFKVARDAAEVKDLEDLGYVFKMNVPTDKNDPDQRPVMMYVLKNGGLPRWNSGGFSLTGMKGRGTSKHDNYYNQFDGQGVANMQSMSSIFSAEQPEVDAQFLPNPGFEPEMKNRLVPLMNANGVMVDYRYVMKEHVRDQVLERDNRFEHLMGVMAGTTYDKVNSQEHNAELVKVLHDMYKADFKNNPHNYILISNRSTDPEIAETWKLLPDKTKLAARKAFGVDGLYVPKEMVLPLFGYRKGSLSALFDKENRNKLEQGFVEFANWMVERYAIHRLKMTPKEAEDYAKRTKTAVRKTEDVWQEVVQEMKNTIVIKTVSVLWGNVMSNFSLLLANGVPVHKLVSYQLEGLRAVMDYTRDRDALAQLDLRIAVTPAGVALNEMLSEQARLQDAIARNPATELVDQGLLPSIVEDVGMEDNPYSYKSGLVKKVEARTAKLNPQVKRVAEYVYMKHDTVLYKVLNKSTQYSDFVGRYALYKHETTKKNPMSKADALFSASEAFVNYDIPMPRTVQYLDDHGFMNFVKYFYSIQRVIFRLVKDKPLHVINTLMLNNLLGDLPIITDSSALVRIGNNPFSLGAFGYPMALDNLATVEVGTGLFK